MTLESPGDIVIYRSKLNAKINRNFEVFTPTDFLAAITQHIPDKGAQMVRYCGWYSNKMRGVRRRPASSAAPRSRVSGTGNNCRLTPRRPRRQYLLNGMRDLKNQFSSPAQRSVHAPTKKQFPINLLCDGGELRGIVEAKKLTLGPQGVLTQAQRYARVRRQARSCHIARGPDPAFERNP
jgi:hypothetical protein